MKLTPTPAADRAAQLAEELEAARRELIAGKEALGSAELDGDTAARDTAARAIQRAQDRVDALVAAIAALTQRDAAKARKAAQEDRARRLAIVAENGKAREKIAPEIERLVGALRVQFDRLRSTTVAIAG